MPALLVAGNTWGDTCERRPADHVIKEKKLSTFKPSGEMVRLAESVMVAMAHEQTIRPIVEGYEKAILERHQFKPDQCWADKGLKGATDTILDPGRTFLLSDEDAQVYFSECQAARDAAGLKVEKPEYCPLLVAETLRIQAEKALLEEMGTLPNLKGLENVLNLGVEAHGRAVDLCLKLLAPYCRDSSEILGGLMGGAVKEAAPPSAPGQRG